ncbi:chalcone-flavanone isomerase-domain-containing protein [Amanita rubescens]|nr:chalcone-flavanone isomerase-domain-containing protein [Amanita rubescens]
MFRLLFRSPQCPPVFATSLTARTWTRNQTGRFFSSAGRQTGQSTSRGTWFGIVTAGIACAAVVASQRKVYLDAPSTQGIASQGTDTEEVVVDTATSIAFPKTLDVPAKVKIPTLSLVGLGVRTVSFLGIKVYSVGFYADLNDPNLKIPKDMPTEEKVKYIVGNTTCVVRIVPTRTTSYSHLRDAFMRALQARMTQAKLNNTLTEEEAIVVGSSMRKLKSIFPNSSLKKHTPFDMLLTGPMPNRPRSLIFRDLGTIENDWVATELVLHYFEGDAPSPAMKKSVLERLESFRKS